MTDQEIARRALDELEIRNLVARLAQLADDGGVEEYVALFAEDASWQGAPGPGPGGKSYNQVRRGHADIRAGAKERLASGIQGPDSHTHHVVTNTAVWLSGDTARGKSFYLYFVNTNGKPEVDRMGVYHDEFRRTPGGWKMAKRVIVPG